MLVLGIDVGTQGARVVACDGSGRVEALAERSFRADGPSNLPSGWIEQDPNEWWRATMTALQQVIQTLIGKGHLVSIIRGVSVTSTSGTVVAVDAAGVSLGLALMYNDRRAEAEAREVNEAGAALAEKLGYRFGSSFALPKLLWLRRHDPDRFRAARWFLSPTDFIVGKLTGRFGITDYTNALKTGYDLVEQRWPAFIEDRLGIPLERLPQVVAPGVRVGGVVAEVFQQTGLPEDTPVVAGMTDGCASQVSTGAIAPGQWNSTLGTTLVLKGVTPQIIRDPAGRVYCHRHPDGHWLPGGASNTGGECIARRFDPKNLDALGARAKRLTPTNLIAYPLVRVGERFPFANPKAEGFLLGEARDEAELYTAYLEGVGYVERLSYEVLGQLGAEIGGPIHAAGGATRSAVWLQIRANILQKSLVVPVESGGAMGAAIIAAGGTVHEGIVAASRAMVRLNPPVEPQAKRWAAYEERYARFCAELRHRGYLS